MLPRPLALALAVLRRRLVVPPDLVLVNRQPVEANGPARVDLVGADADLRAEAVPHPVRQPRRRVPVDARRVDAVHKVLRLGAVRREDGVCVVRAVGVDVRNGLVHGSDGLDGEREAEVFRVVVLRDGVLDGALGEGREQFREGGLAGGVEAERHALLGQGGGHAGEDCAEGLVLDEQRLDAVARGRVARLGVDDGDGGLVLVCRGGEVDAAEAVGVAQDGDLGVLLDVADELVGAARDDEVDVAVLAEELEDGVARGDELDGRVGDLRLGEGGGDDLGDGDEGFRRFFASCDGGVSFIS